MVVDPQVIAIEHTVETEHDALAFPGLWNGERGAVIAGQRARTVVFRLAESIGFPASRNRNLLPTAVDGRNGLMETRFFLSGYFSYHLDIPFSV